MTDWEKRDRENADKFLAVIDEVLLTLGQEPLETNPNFEWVPDGTYPCYELKVEGAAPLSISVLREFDVWVDGLTEILNFEVEHLEFIRRDLPRILTSEVRVEQRRFRLLVTFADAGGVWLRHSFLGDKRIDRVYPPAFAVPQL
ncbi:MAG: hypothetical protein ACI81L_003294 [Verrucomicrobiales bacterium]|jgi:hypothetical protein